MVVEMLSPTIQDLFTGNKEYSFYEISPIASGSLMMMASGSVYLVSAYSSELQTKLAMTSSEIATFTFVLATGSWLGIVPMVFTDYYGPKRTSLLGALMMLVGYLVVAATAHGNISLSSSWVVFFGFVIGHGSAWCVVGAFFPNVANTLPEHRGAVFGLLQANYALSSGVFTQLLEVFSLGVCDFLLMTGISMSLTILIAWPSNHNIVGDNNNTDTLLIIPLAVIISVIAISVALASILDSEAPHIVVLALFGAYVLGVLIISSIVFYLYGMVVFGLRNSFDLVEEDKFQLNTLQMAIYTNRKDESGDTESSSLLKPHQPKPEPASVNPLHVESNGNESSSDTENSSTSITRNVSFNRLNTSNNDTNDKSKSSDVSLMTTLKTLKFWLLFFTLAVGAGAGLTVLYNIAKIVDAHSGSGSDDDVHSPLKTNSVALFSAFNTAGRIVFGFVSDILSVKKGISRAWLLGANCLLMAVGNFLMAYVILSTFKFVVVICAFSYGGFMSLIPALIADIYGTSTYTAFFTLTGFAPILGVELLYNVLSTEVYDQYTEDGETCFDNAACFKLTFIVIAGCSVVASIFAAMLAKLVQREGIAR